MSDRAAHPASVSAADAATFEVVRPRLFGIAYRVLGGAAEAEEVVQDAWIRWHRTNRGDVRDANAFLATATTRLAINVADSARARHEAELLELSEINARQILVRARAALGSERRRRISRGEHRPLLMAFTTASQTGEVAQLEQMLAGDVLASDLPSVAA